MDFRDIILRRCTEADLETILCLQSEVCEGLGDESLLRKNTKEMFLRCFGEPHVTFGLFVKEILAAAAVLFDGAGTDEDLSVGMIHGCGGRPINFKLIMVKKEFRGLGFQSALMSFLERFAYQKGYTVMCATVSPKNEFSLNNMRRKGFKFDHNASKYGGLERSVFYKRFQEDVGAYEDSVVKRIESLEGAEYDAAAPLNGINLAGCFEGSIQNAMTGDVVEYLDTDRGNFYYGLLLKKDSLLTCIYNPAVQKIILTEVKDTIQTLRYSRILVSAAY